MRRLFPLILALFLAVNFAVMPPAFAARALRITYVLPEGAVNPAENPSTCVLPLAQPIPLASPTLTGHTFCGWRNSYGNYVSSITNNTTDTVFTAVFEPNTYKIQYVLTTRPGLQFIHVNNKFNPVSYTYGVAQPIQGVWPPQGYAFCGWFSDPACTVGPLDEIAAGTLGDVLLYALWMTPEELDQKEILERHWGDLNGDGVVSAQDARLALRASVDLEHFSPEVTARADFAKKGRLGAEDARLLLRVSVDLVSLPAVLRQYGLMD